MIVTLLLLAGIFAELSLLGFGGANAVLPELQRQVVTLHHWMSATDLASLYALAQAAPGPNMMIVTLAGNRIAGMPGALVATISVLTPSSILLGIVLHLWHRFKHNSWRTVLQRALVPVTTGLVASSAILITGSADRQQAGLLLITLVAAVATLRLRLHPLLILAGGAVAGASGILPL